MAVAEGLGPGSEVDEDEPDKSMTAAAEVVDAIAVADNGSGWLCVPSYVEIKTDMSCEHLCTLIYT